MFEKVIDDNCVMRHPDGSPALLASLTFYIWLLAIIAFGGVLVVWMAVNLFTGNL